MAESTRISESKTDIVESEKFNPPLPSSDSDFFESTVYEPPAQPALDESTVDDPTPNPVESLWRRSEKLKTAAGGMLSFS